MDTINYYRFRKFDNDYFITTDIGRYCFLTQEEFNELNQFGADRELDCMTAEKLRCACVLVDDIKLDKEIDLTREKQSFLFDGTSLHIVVVTLRCNMKCIYCHASSKCESEVAYDMDTETAKKVVDFIFQTPSKAITIEFQGGEPLLNWDVVKYIITYAKEINKQAKKDIRFSVVTNLINMDEEKMKYLIENDVGLCTSLDGPKEVHDYNRKYNQGSSYDFVADWIRKFNNAYKERKSAKTVGALVTLTKKSLDYPIEIVNSYVDLGLEEIHLRFLNDLGMDKESWDKLAYSPEEYISFWFKAMEHISKLNKKGIRIKERIVEIMANKISNDFDPNYLDLRSPCGAAIGQLAYDFDGKIYSCDEGRMVGEDMFLLGDVKKDKYKDVLSCDKTCAIVNASLNDQYVCDDCVYKPYCGVCPVCSYAEQGNIIPKVTQTARCKIYKAQFDWVVRERFLNKDNKNIN